MAALPAGARLAAARAFRLHDVAGPGIRPLLCAVTTPSRASPRPGSSHQAEPRLRRAPVPADYAPPQAPDSTVPSARRGPLSSAPTATRLPRLARLAAGPGNGRRSQPDPGARPPPMSSGCCSFQPNAGGAARLPGTTILAPAAVELRAGFRPRELLMMGNSQMPRRRRLASARPEESGARPGCLRWCVPLGIEAGPATRLPSRPDRPLSSWTVYHG